MSRNRGDIEAMTENKTPRNTYEQIEKNSLAPYAQLSTKTLGRTYKEPECYFRTAYYKDLGKIIHSMAFRFLEYKTQVFVNNKGDYYRTRLTHTLEVGQMSVGLARILGVNQDLAHAIALAHDLGHTPFGHPGETTMNDLLKEEGGFEHNLQSYRVVTKLEERYPDFPGLNLTYEVLEGIIKHSTVYDRPTPVKGFEDVGYPTIEAQIVNGADEIAFMNHDLDDGFHWGIITVDSLKDVSLWDKTFKEVQRELPNATTRMHRIRTISSLINKLIDDIQKETKKRILDMGIKSTDDVRLKGKNVVSFSETMKKRTSEAKAFLLQNMYHHPEIKEMAEKARNIITDLFNAYKADPKLLPEKYYKRYEDTRQNRHIGDYIAGMTDRFALKEHKKLF